MTDDDLLTPKPVAANEARKADVLARTLIAEHDRTGKPVQQAAAWH